MDLGFLNLAQEASKVCCYLLKSSRRHRFSIGLVFHGWPLQLWNEMKWNPTPWPFETTINILSDNLCRCSRSISIAANLSTKDRDWRESSFFKRALKLTPKWSQEASRRPWIFPTCHATENGSIRVDRNAQTSRGMEPQGQLWPWDDFMIYN